jgi:hypothetical protein
VDTIGVTLAQHASGVLSGGRSRYSYTVFTGNFSAYRSHLTTSSSVVRAVMPASHPASCHHEANGRIAIGME